MLIYIPAPRNVPQLCHMLDDMGRPSAAQVGKALDVAPRTVERWIAANDAPRPAALALYWVTRWGRSAVDCQATNDARLAFGLVGALERENLRLRGELARLLVVGDFGSANDPAQRPHLPAPAVHLVRSRAA